MYGKLDSMTSKKPEGASNTAAGYFGRQLRKARLARSWSLDELGGRSGINPTYLSKIETGHQPPTAKTALAIDTAFGGHQWSELYRETKTWQPPGFRDWSEHEQATTTLRDFCPTVITGLLQTEDYARALLETAVGATADIVATRLKSRMDRQRAMLGKDLRWWFIIDEPSLHRLVGSPAIMSVQLRHLLEFAAMPRVTMQVLPPVAHPAGASGFVVADTACYVEHLLAGYVYVEDEKLSVVAETFDVLRAECHRASESMQIIEEMRQKWNGGSPLIQTPTGGTASK